MLVINMLDSVVSDHTLIKANFDKLGKVMVEIDEADVGEFNKSINAIIKNINYKLYPTNNNLNDKYLPDFLCSMLRLLGNINLISVDDIEILDDNLKSKLYIKTDEVINKLAEEYLKDIKNQFLELWNFVALSSENYINNIMDDYKKNNKPDDCTLVIHTLNDVTKEIVSTYLILAGIAWPEKEDE